MLKVKTFEIGLTVTAPFFRKFFSRVTPRPPLRGVLIYEITTISKLFWKNRAKTQNTSNIENIAKNWQFVSKKSTSSLEQKDIDVRNVP